MRQIITSADERIGRWIATRAGGTWSPGRGQAIALIKQHQIIAGVLYEDYNGVNICVHIAAVDSRRWMDREYLWIIFHYPFVQLGCRRLTALVAEGNKSSARFVEHLGFVLEATLSDAHPSGSILIYVMRKENCRWLKLAERYGYGKEQRAGCTGL